MKNYKKHIENLARNEESLVFKNSSARHASMVLSSIFGHSTEYLRIFAGTLNGEVQNEEYITQMHLYLKGNGKLKILLDNYTQINTELLELFKKYNYLNPDLVELKQTTQYIIDKETNERLHFTVGDSKMYRIENDITTRTATCSFNYPTLSVNLEKIFDKMFSNSDAKEISLV